MNNPLARDKVREVELVESLGSRTDVRALLALTEDPLRSLGSDLLQSMLPLSA